MKNKFVVLQNKHIADKYLLSKVNSKLSLDNPVIEIISVYFLKLNKSLINKDNLKSLLSAQKFIYKKNQTFVAPRLGSISPWSSKATDILNNCGIKEVDRIECGICYQFSDPIDLNSVFEQDFCDRMMDSVYENTEDLAELFHDFTPKQDGTVSLLKNPKHITAIDQELGLALSSSEKEYLLKSYQKINKEPTIAELMMFAQANSEHCRHKIFNATWTIDNIEQKKSLFSMIRNTEKNTPKPSISAYKDNSAVFAGGETKRWILNEKNQYTLQNNIADILIKVETHNHPTAISPFPGAATGSGGEIRDEAATGQGSKPKVGLTGFSVSHLKIPNHKRIWENDTIGKPNRIASPLAIMIEAPLGAAAFNNEFGRPNICGYFRSLEIKTEDYGWRGYHKPIMLAGGLGTINHDLAVKQDTQVGDILVVLGGPAMLIGLGGGAASSMSSGSSNEDLDYASVQRGNPEMERRCQEVIDACWTKEANSPIRSIHDVGAGGLSNAMPELLDDASLGGKLELRNLQIDTTAMTPMEIWCNESQERYVISIKPNKIDEFKEMCVRERCPYAVLGMATTKRDLIVSDKRFKTNPVEVPMELLFGETPKTHKNIKTIEPKSKNTQLDNLDLEKAIFDVLNFPTVASKKYLITIGDRTVSGLVHRDQMVGPWQVPVADCGVSIRDFHSNSGEAMSIGEKAPIALLNGAAAARMSVAESIMNIAPNNIGDLPQIKLSANWMAASGLGREDQVLFEAVKAIGEELCPKLGIGIPVGKDSLSMNTKWQDGGEKQITAPVSLIISAFTNVQDVRKSITPYFDSSMVQNLYFIDLAKGKKRLGASSLAQVYQQLGSEVPDIEDVDLLIEFWTTIQEGISQQIISAYHDISDGGLVTAVLEMLFASQIGAEINLDFSEKSVIETLFAEELGAIIAVNNNNLKAFNELLSASELEQYTHKLATTELQDNLDVSFVKNSNNVFTDSVLNLQQSWSKTSHLIASLRDNPESCKQEFDAIKLVDKGLSPKVSFEFDKKIIAPYINFNAKPKVAILREQGVNGQKEMAMAFHQSGFDCYDVHMQDILSGKTNINDFQGMAACGGFSYGDVLGAGKGWANSILFHEKIKKQFSDYFKDYNKFTLGVCNGCQMISSLKNIIPGAQDWPQFSRNNSRQFEARFSSLKIQKSSSLFFADMQGAEIPVAIAHGEGQALFNSSSNSRNIIAAKYCDNNGDATQTYPLNPNGSQKAAAAVTNDVGNVMIMMPHPERVFRAVQMSWSPSQWKENSPWMKMFYNARKFVK